MEIIIKNPLMLLLFLIVPILIALHYYFFEHTKKRAMKFANFSAMKRVTGTHLITKNTSQLILRIIIISILILSASQPVIWHEKDTSINDYVIAIDSSASMVSEDVLPDRITVAKQAASSFVDSLDSQTKIGIISFSGISFIKVPITYDKFKLKEGIEKIRIELAGGTDIGGALITSVNLLNPSEKSKAVILITDGSDTAGSFIDESVETAIQYVTESHVVVHTIGIGTGLGKVGYVDDPALNAIYDKNTLIKISEITGGRFYEVKSTAEIALAFKDIELNKEKAKVSFEASGMFLAIAIILLIVEWVLLNTKFRAIP